MCTGFSLKKTSTVSLSIDVSINTIRCVVYLLRIFKMFHGLMNNPLYIILRSAHTLYLCVLCGSQNKQRLFPYTALTDWFL